MRLTVPELMLYVSIGALLMLFDAVSGLVDHAKEKTGYCTK